MQSHILQNSKIGEKCNIGQNYTFHFNLRGRKWESPDNKIIYFNTIEVWRVEQSEQELEPEQTVAAPVDSRTLSDDLPF